MERNGEPSAIVRKESFNAFQRAFLLKSSRRYVWWKQQEEALAHPQRILAQVMNLGIWDDWCSLVELFSAEELREVLDRAEVGSSAHVLGLFGIAVSPVPFLPCLRESFNERGKDLCASF